MCKKTECIYLGTTKNSGVQPSTVQVYKGIATFFYLLYVRYCYGTSTYSTFGTYVLLRYFYA